MSLSATLLLCHEFVLGCASPWDVVCVWLTNAPSEGPTHDIGTVTLARYHLRYRRMGSGEAIASASRTALRQEGAGETGRKAEEDMVVMRACWAETVRRGGKIVVETVGKGGGQSSGGDARGKWGTDGGSGDFGESGEIVDARGGQGRFTSTVAPRRHVVGAHAARWVA